MSITFSFQIASFHSAATSHDLMNSQSVTTSPAGDALTVSLLYVNIWSLDTEHYPSVITLLDFKAYFDFNK